VLQCQRGRMFVACYSASGAWCDLAHFGALGSGTLTIHRSKPVTVFSKRLSCSREISFVLMVLAGLFMVNNAGFLGCRTLHGPTFRP
jgi:hypothetical protein